jgi:PKD repeat protein
MMKALLKSIVFFIAILFFNAPAAAQAPAASFIQSATTGCVPFTVSFTNSSVNAASYYWDFGNGNNSVVVNPVNVYQAPGTYTVKLFATSASGQTDSLVATNLITVIASPVSSFYPQTTASCPDGNSFSFVNTSTGGSSWMWDFGDGNTSTQQNPTHSYSLPGFYTVKLIATNSNGCSDIEIIPQCIQVYPEPSVSFSVNDTTACSPSQAFAFNTATPGSYWWSFGDGNNSSQQNPSHAYSNPGNYNVSLVVTNSFGCSDTLTQENFIIIYPQQTPAFSASDSSGCPPFTVTFGSLTANATGWAWDFGDGNTSALQNPTHTYQDTGSYDVTLTFTAANGCTYTNTASDFITVQNNPVAAFTVANTSGCAPLAAQFTNQSVNSGSWYWEFGDGYTSTQQDPVHNYYGSNSYNVTLHAYNSAGCHSVYTMPAAVSASSPSTNFTASNVNGCAPLPVTFTNTTQGAVSYFWDFGDGNTSTQQNPSHTYATPGMYTVMLISANAQGCIDTMAMPGLVGVINTAASYVAPPTVSACAPFTTSFSGNTPGATSWHWDFGDGNTSTQQSPVHTYTTAGTYTVSLVIQMNTGCTEFYNEFRTYNIEAATPGFVLTQTQCEPYTVTFTDTTPGATGWYWSFGDGNTSTQQNPSHAYPGADLYTVSLTATTPAGCSSTIIQSNAVNYLGCSVSSGGPAASGGNGWSFVPVSGCVPLTMVFNNVLTGTVSWYWDFGDGHTSTQQNPLHIYTEPGVYTVTMLGQDASGQTDTVVYTNYVDANGTLASFTILPITNCQDNQLSFNDNSVNAAAWNWSFGDGNTSNIQNPTHTYYPGSTNFSIVLTATGPEGCASMVSANTFTGSGSPIWANDNDVCFNHAVNFSCATAYSSYYWNFGDGNYSTQAAPSHSYSNAGAYAVTLIATDASGCPDTFSLATPIIVHEPLPNFTATPTGTCSQLAMQFNNLSTGTGQPVNNFCLWSFGDNTAQQWSATPTHIYPAPGTYNVTLTGYYPGGCSNTITLPVTVAATQADFSFTQSSTCFPITITCTDSSTNAVSWLWNFGDGNTSTQQHPQHTFASMPSDSITLTVTDIKGCTSTVTKANVQRFGTAFSPSVSSGCGPLEVSFTDSSLSASAWLWSFGDGNTSTQQNPIHVYTSPGSYTVTLISQAPGGCSDTMIAGPVNVYMPAADFISPTPAACAPSLATFTNQSSNASTLLWDFGDGSHSTAANPSHIYNLPGAYTITLIAGASGCYDTIVKQEYIHVLGPVANFSSASSSFCLQGNAQFNDLSTGAATWSWNFGDGNISAQQNPQHTYQSPGSYSIMLTVQDTLGCSSSFTLPAPVIVNPLPIASFLASDTVACAPAGVSFTDQSQGAASYSWSFGNNSSSSQASPSHIYNNAGSFQVSLVVTNSYGCSDTALRSLVINPSPIAQFSASVYEGCSPLSTVFTDLSISSLPLTYSWNLGNNNVSTGQNPQTVYQLPGTYPVSLIVTNPFGCSDTMAQPATINVFDTLAPPASPILTATVSSDTSTYIIWTPSTAADFAYYIVYRMDNATGEFAQAGVVSDMGISSFSDNGLNTLHNTYTYKIQAVDICGNRLALETLAPHTTVNVTATALGEDIGVSWTAYEGASVQTYEVFRMEQGNPVPVHIATVPSTVQSVIDSGIVCPLNYSYRVKATGLNNLAISSASDTSIAAPSVNLLAGQKVNVVRSTVVDNSSILTEWMAPEIAPESVTGYNIYRAGNDQQFALIASLPSAAFAYIDNGVNVNESNYFYRVEIINSCGVSGQPGLIGSSILLTASAGEASNFLSWTAYEGWEMGVDFYIIEKQNDQGQWEVIKVVEPTVLEFEDK